MRFRRQFGAFHMMPRLRDEDRLAVDLLLDRAVSGSAGNGSGNGSGSGSGNGHSASSFTPVNGAVPEQVARVQAVLRVLEMMPAEDPPADLLERTMRRVADETQDPAALRPIQPATGDTYMPHA
jgi:hypothetical protein